MTPRRSVTCSPSTPTSTCSTPTRWWRPGGTGESFDWRLAKLHGGTPPLVLSGGLTAENVGEAIAAVHPYAVDSASGTEAEPGRKDPAKLEAFFEAVAAADARIGAPA